MIWINSIGIRSGFSGSIGLGEIDRLFVSSDGNSYSLYGTLFRIDETGTVVPPSEQNFLSPGSIERYLEDHIAERRILSQEVSRLIDVRSDVLEGRYDYGVSELLLERLYELKFNTVKQLPLFITGGQLGYPELEKNDEDRNPFENLWEEFSLVKEGPKRYREEDYVQVIRSEIFERQPSTSQDDTVLYSQYGVFEGPQTAPALLKEAAMSSPDIKEGYVAIDENTGTFETEEF